MTKKNESTLVELTPNPVVAFGMRLGRDELIAAGWSVFWTAIVKLALVLWGSDKISLEKQALILAIAGPLFEKPGLISAYIKDTVNLYKQTPEGERESHRFYITKVIKDSWPTLRADLLYHDPGYTLILWLLIRNISSTSLLLVALLSAVSFSTAVIIAAGLDVLTIKLMYHFLTGKLQRAGFKRKTYYETRFLIDATDDERYSSDKVLDFLQKHFNLPIKSQQTNVDVYLNKYTEKVFNGRRPYLRFRQRTDKNGKITKQAVQVMYTCSRQLHNKSDCLYRCFITPKEKYGYDFPHDASMPWEPEKIKNAVIASIVKRLCNTKERKKVTFIREAIMDDALFISIDRPTDSTSGTNIYWLEIKVRENLKRLEETSDFIAWKLPVRATTKTKCDALWSGKESRAEAQGRRVGKRMREEV